MVEKRRPGLQRTGDTFQHLDVGGIIEVAQTGADTIDAVKGFIETEFAHIAVNEIDLLIQNLLHENFHIAVLF